MRIVFHPLYNSSFNSPFAFTFKKKQSKCKDVSVFLSLLKYPTVPLDENKSLIPVRKSHCHGLSEWRSMAENQHDPTSMLH